MDPAYIAGVFDGDGSISVSVVGPPGKKGYLLKVELTQCDIEYLGCINTAVGGGGKIYTVLERQRPRNQSGAAYAP